MVRKSLYLHSTLIRISRFENSHVHPCLGLWKLLKSESLKTHQQLKPFSTEGMLCLAILFFLVTHNLYFSPAAPRTEPHPKSADLLDVQHPSLSLSSSSLIDHTRTHRSHADQLASRSCARDQRWMGYPCWVARSCWHGKMGWP